MRKSTIAIASALIGFSYVSAEAQTIRFGDDRGGFSFRFGRDDRKGDVEGKRANCEVYARIANVQAEANRRFRCGYRGPKWNPEIGGHFRWCRYAQRRAVREEQRSRAEDLAVCFDKLGDFDER